MTVRLSAIILVIYQNRQLMLYFIFIAMIVSIFYFIQSDRLFLRLLTIPMGIATEFLMVHLFL